MMRYEYLHCTLLDFAKTLETDITKITSMASSSTSNHGSETRNFLEAALNGNLKLVKRLVRELDYGDGLTTTVVANVKDDKGVTALHYAAAGGKTHVCKYLIEELKLDINLKDDQGNAPLHHATLEEHLPTVIYLLEKGADPTTVNDKRLTSLHFAAQTGYKKLLRLLISKGAVIDAEADTGTPLLCASAHGKKEAMKILLENNANPNKIFYHIFSPLVVSILDGSFECVKILLQAGADANIGPCGVTPLEVAVSKGETEIIKCLLKAGANPNVVDMCGVTPIEAAALLGNHGDVMVLFPVTSQISKISDWSCGGIVTYVHSDEAREERKLKRKEYFMYTKLKGEEAFKREHYLDAIYCYSEAIDASPFDAIVRSNRSLCWARLNEGFYVHIDAQVCLLLRPDWPKAYYRVGVAWSLLKEYSRAADSFCLGWKLDPENKELEAAFWEAAGAEILHMCLSRT